MSVIHPLTYEETRLSASINTRSLSLWEQGYTFERCDNDPASPFFDVWVVTKPDRKTAYFVQVGKDAYCTCKSHERWDVCKHRLALERTLADDAARVAEYERMMADCEEERYGCDYPY